MGGKPLTACRILLITPRTWVRRGWTKDQVEKWVKAAGGAVHRDFDEHSTTHLVVEEQAWKNKIRHVQLALETNDNGGKVYIVHPDWLDSCLRGQKKERERAYLWEKLDEEANGGAKKKHGARGHEADEDGKNGEVPRKTHQAMLGEVLQEGTEDYVVDHDRRQYEAELAGRQKAEKEREEAEAERKAEEEELRKQKSKQRAAEMKKTAKKGRGEEFNRNYHAYTDSIGFVYDIMLTRVDTLANRNERINLTLFESNDKAPQTYATNLHFAGTGKQPMNNIIAVIGSNFETAWRTFCKAFEEATGVDWDDRVKAHNDRVEARNHDRETSDPYSARRGENGKVKSSSKTAEEEIPLDKRVFEYMPPIHASIGWLPNGKEAVPEVLKQIRAKVTGKRDRTEQWMMSGGDGSDSEAPSQSPHQSTEQTRVRTHIDLTEDDPADNDGGSPVASGDEDSDSNVESDNDEIMETAEEKAAADDLLNGASTGAFDVESLLAGTHEWTTEGDMFDIGDSTQQQQQNFVFDEDLDEDPGNDQSKTQTTGFDLDFQVPGEDLDAKYAAPATGNAELQADVAEHDALDGTLTDQTQLAAVVAENLLNMGCKDGGLVVVPETEQLEAAAGIGKRKRYQASAEDVEPAAKRFDGEVEETAT